MIKRKLKYFFIGRNTEKLIKDSRYIDFSKVKSVAILLDYNDMGDINTGEIIAKLDKLAVESNLFVVNGEDKEHKSFINVGKDSFDTWGKLIDETVEKALAKDYEVLFDFRKSAERIGEYIFSHIKKKYSVGISENIGTNDIVISNFGENTDFNTLINFLNNLKEA